MIVSRINKHFIQNLYICSICGGCGSGRGCGPGGGGEWGSKLLEVFILRFQPF